jgi:hypothetical protein
MGGGEGGHIQLPCRDDQAPECPDGDLTGGGIT